MLKLLTLLMTLHTVFAQFVVSADKTSYTASDTMVVSWSESSDSVLNLKNQDVGQVLLCTCNTTDTFTCRSMKDNLAVSDGKTSIPISDIVTFGPDGNYTLQFATKNSKDNSQYALAYSASWMSITGMTGTGSAGEDCKVPSDSDNKVPGTASSSIISWTTYTLPSSLSGVSGYLVPYTWQKGATRTAPFQRTPGTKVTQTVTPSRRYPTSSMVSTFQTYYFNKYMPVQTATPGASSTAYQSENAVATIATTPSGKAPTKVVPVLSLASETSSASGKANGRRRRWAD